MNSAGYTLPISTIALVAVILRKLSSFSGFISKNLSPDIFYRLERLSLLFSYTQWESRPILCDRAGQLITRSRPIFAYICGYRFSVLRTIIAAALLNTEHEFSIFLTFIAVALELN